MAADIRTNFGEDVARIVEGCTDSFVENSENKPPWHERKRAYLKRLRKEPLDAQLVSAADKLYNARAILEDFRLIGDDIWSRFKRGRKDQLWALQPQPPGIAVSLVESLLDSDVLHLPPVPFNDEKRQMARA